MSKKQLLREEIIKEIATEDGGTRSEIKEIVDTQFEFIADIFRRGAFEGVRMPFFGVFWAKPGRVQAVNEQAARQRAKK